eukprot:330341_1
MGAVLSLSGSKWSGDKDKRGKQSQHNQNKQNKPEENKMQKPDDAKEKIQEEDSFKFKLMDQTEELITRFHYEREMLIGIWQRGALSHSSVFICYFSKIKDKEA